METFREFSFEAAHEIPPYSTVHGHSFVVQVVLQGEPDPVFGWVESLTVLEPKIDAVRSALDHKFLNEIEGLKVPSLENIAAWVWGRLEADGVRHLERVTVRRGAAGHGEGCTFRRPRAAA
jgi:6-pyruvoyltetrahydropterin/6-carboxytetrahydropterin synthase